jgi:hypothetical protein
MQTAALNPELRSSSAGANQDTCNQEVAAAYLNDSQSAARQRKQCDQSMGKLLLDLSGAARQGFYLVGVVR